MTLKQWEATAGTLATHPATETGAVSVVVDHTHPARPELWRLDDYRVSSVSGVVVWLIPQR